MNAEGCNMEHMTIEEMISTLDGAAGRLLVSAMRDPVVREAMEMITSVSIALGDVDAIEYVDYGDDEDDIPPVK